MSSILKLPIEIICIIGEMCTWGCYPVRHCSLASYASAHASLARTSRGMYNILNRRLYRRNLGEDPHEHSCVLWAIKNRRLETIKRAVEYGADLNNNGLVDSPDTRSKCRERVSYATPLFVAVKYDQAVVFDYLMEQDVDINVPSGDCSFSCSQDGMCFPLHFCFLERSLIPGSDKHCYYMNALLRKGASYFGRNKPVEAHVIAMCSGVDHDLVFRILEKSKEVDLVKVVTYAIGQGNFSLVKSMLRKYPETNFSLPVSSTRYSRNKENILHLAVRRDGVPRSLIKLLLRRPEFHPNMKTADGRTPLHLALKWRPDVKIMKLLMQRPDFEYLPDNDGWTPLHRAACNSSKEAFELIMEYPGVDINETTENGDTALHCAALHGRSIFSNSVQIAEFLLNHTGFDPNAINKQGRSALQETCRRNKHDSSIQLLGHRRINLPVAEENGGTLLHVTVRHSSLRVLHKLLKKQPKIDVNAEDDDGFTALHVVFTGRLPILAPGTPRVKELEELLIPHVECLLNAGALAGAANGSASPPLLYALHHNLHKIASLLLKRGATPMIPSTDIQTDIRDTSTQSRCNKAS